MRYRGSMNSVVWILTETRQRATFHMVGMGIRDTGIPVTDRGWHQRAIVISGNNWTRQIRGRRWSDGDWVLADAGDRDLDEKLFQLHVQGAPKDPPLRWL